MHGPSCSRGTKILRPENHASNPKCPLFSSSQTDKIAKSQILAVYICLSVEFCEDISSGEETKVILRLFTAQVTCIILGIENLEPKVCIKPVYVPGEETYVHTNVDGKPKRDQNLRRTK